MQNYYGRVDKVATYQATDRTISIGFKLVAFAPEDLRVVYQKLGWLTSMVYPQYQSSIYRAGPVVRMRVGDLINAVGTEGNRGVPGVITSMDFNYDNSTWELLKDRRVPKEIDVTMNFHVLHEFPIGVVHALGDTKSDLFFGGIQPGGAATFGTTNSYVNIDRFRAAFGSDYLNDTRLQAENTSNGSTT
jgi:hypothetical protein